MPPSHGAFSTEVLAATSEGMESMMSERLASYRRRPAVAPEREAGRDDDLLIARAAQGDDAACRELVDRHLAGILAFAARTLGDPIEAEDVAQDTFERMWLHAAGWQPGRARLTTWLHRIAYNLCVDRLRKRREDVLDDSNESRDPKPTAPDLIAEKELAGHVRDALGRLTDQQRIALTLCHYQGLRNAEAAEVMELTVEAVESLLVRARRSIRAQLESIAPSLLGEG